MALTIGELQTAGAPQNGVTWATSTSSGVATNVASKLWVLLMQDSLQKALLPRQLIQPHHLFTQRRHQDNVPLQNTNQTGRSLWQDLPAMAIIATMLMLAMLTRS